MSDNDQWLFKATELEAQLQQTRKRTDELESFAQSIDKLIHLPDGSRKASVSTDEVSTLLDWINTNKG